jgi:hypothetical protein
MKLWSLAILFLFMSSLASLAFAQGARSDASQEKGPKDQLVDRYLYQINETLNRTKELTPKCADCGVYMTGRESEKSPACRKTYRDLFKIRETQAQEPKEPVGIDMRLLFGYMDNVGEVDDFYAGVASMAVLTSDCEPGLFACGFKRDPKDMQMLRKTIQVLGPDGKLRRRVIKLKLAWSSVRSDEKLNRGAFAEQQRERTGVMEREWVDGLQKSDVLLYVGHAREGGGPDFGPPKVNPKTRRTDFDWHRKNGPGVKVMEETLARSEKTPKILGLFACYAQDHWSEKLKKAAPRSGLIMTGDSEFEAIVGQAIATIDSTLGLRCEEEFGRSVNVINKIDTRKGEEPVPPVKVENLFR